MRIGIFSPLGIYTFKDFFEKEDQQLLDELSQGVAPSIQALTKSMLKAGHFLRIFCIGKKNAIIRGHNIEIVIIDAHPSFPIKYLWGPYIKGKIIYTAAKDYVNDLDIIHAHWSYEYAWAAKQFATRVPVLCTVRDWAPLIFRMERYKMKPLWVFKWIMASQLYRNKNIHFIANSPYTASLLKAHCGIEAPVIPNSVEDDFFDNVMHHIPSNVKIVCISSSNDKRKNIISLLKAYQIVRLHIPNVRLQLIGAPFTPQNTVVKIWQRDGLIDNSIELIGKVVHSDLTTYLDNATIFVTPSLEETFGNTLLEAIARKVPVIAGESSGAVPYVLHHGEAGYLCDVTSPTSIANTILSVIAHLSDAMQKSEKAFHIIQNEYCEQTVCQQHIQLYKSIQHEHH